MKLSALAALLFAAPVTAADIPAQQLHESMAYSEMHKDEIDIDCFEVVTRGTTQTCITFGQWCRIHRAMGEPVDKSPRCMAELEPEPEYARYGQ